MLILKKTTSKEINVALFPYLPKQSINQKHDEICIPFEYRPLTDEEKKRYSGQKQQDKIIRCRRTGNPGKITPL